MNNWKNKVLALAFMLVFILALAACGGGGIEDLQGTYVVEGDEASGIVLNFTDDRFRIEMPYSEIEPTITVQGNFVFSGTFSVDNRNRLVLFNIDEDALRDTVVDMVDAFLDYMFMSDPEMVELMQDPDFAEMMNEIIAAEMDGMVDELFDELVDDIDTLTLRFERNLDRLYDDDADMVFVRR